MKRTSLTLESLDYGAQQLAAVDADLGRIYTRLGAPPLWAREPGFASLVHIILEQQISIKAAQTVFDRLCTHLGEMSPQRMVSAGEEELKAFGLTRQKARYCFGLAERIHTGTLNLAQLDALSDTEGREALTAEDADTAVFYSISNCQTGLAGISFGNSLIKKVAGDLAAELPGIARFVTLSPIPGLMDWIREAGVTAWEGDLSALAAHYLLNVKNHNGAPRDAVARFHLGNGAIVHDLHEDGDLSEKGRAGSGGVMVNYLYDLRRTSERHEAFATDHTVAASSAVKSLAAAAQTMLKGG